MRPNFISETEMPRTKINRDQTQIICHRYSFASKFVSGKRVLEVGCGPGFGLGLLSRDARKVVGGDITQGSLDCAKRYYRERVELVSMDAHQLPFKNDCFDIVISMASIIYLNLPIFLKECHRILGKGGMLILNTPNKDLPGFRKSALSNKYYSVPDLSAFLRSSHFDQEIFGAFPMDGEPAGLQTKFQNTIILIGGKAIGLLPKGADIKEALNKFLFHMTVLKNEIDEEMIENSDIKQIPAYPISSNDADFRYRIIYAVAHVDK